MAETLKLKVVTPSGSVLNEDVESFTAQSEKGEFCVLPGHCLLLSSIVAGRMIAKPSGKDVATYAMDRGFIEAGPEHVYVITEKCIDIAELNESELKDEVSSLEEKLAAAEPDTKESSETALALEWAKARLATVEYNSHTK